MSVGPESRLLVVVNPNSTHATTVHKTVLSDIVSTDWDWGTNYETIYTKHPSSIANAEDIATQIKDGDVILSCGGDGLANSVANAVCMSPAEDTHTLFLPFGRGNDISLSTYGPRKIHKKQRFLELLGRGESTQLPALQVERDNADPRIALGYVGMGFTGIAAKKLDDSQERAHAGLPKVLRDMLSARMLVKTALDIEPFSYSDDSGTNVSNELSFVLIKRMAQYLRFNIRRNGETAHRVEFDDKHFILKSLTKAIAEFPTGGYKGDKIQKQTITTHSDTAMQFDGEYEHVPAGTTLRITVVPDAIQTIT